MKTFYIASSSAKENIASVRALALTLKMFGMRWSFDWTIPIESEAEPAKTFAPEGAETDIEAARSADLFVFLLTEEVSRGAHIELGARLGVKKNAHVVLRGQEPYFFYHHPQALIHLDVQDLVDWVKELVATSAPEDVPAGRGATTQDMKRLHLVEPTEEERKSY